MRARASYAASFAAAVAIHAGLAAVVALTLSAAGRPLTTGAAPAAAAEAIRVSLTVRPHAKETSAAAAVPTAGLASTARRTGKVVSAVGRPAEDAESRRGPPPAALSTSASGARPSAAASSPSSAVNASRTTPGVSSLAPSGPLPSRTGGPELPNAVYDGRGLEQSPEKRAAGATVSARLAHPLKVSYPLIARRRGWEGLVLVEVVLGPSGSVLRAQTIRSSGHAVLDAAALSAVESARFDPTTGEAFPVTVVVPVRFELAEGAG